MRVLGTILRAGPICRRGAAALAGRADGASIPPTAPRRYWADSGGDGRAQRTAKLRAVILYKILRREAWEGREDSVPWSDTDRADGFVHLSGPDQVRATVKKWFSGQTELTVLEIDANRLAPETLRWEPSRGGQLFPHVYGHIPLEAVVRAEPLRLDALPT